jgi:hypothetical protein
LEWERRFKLSDGKRINMAELCRVFGVSRQTGYDWRALSRLATVQAAKVRNLTVGALP